MRAGSCFAHGPVAPSIASRSDNSQSLLSTGARLLPATEPVRWCGSVWAGTPTQCDRFRCQKSHPQWRATVRVSLRATLGKFQYPQGIPDSQSGRCPHFQTGHLAPSNWAGRPIPLPFCPTALLVWEVGVITHAVRLYRQHLTGNLFGEFACPLIHLLLELPTLEYLVESLTACVFDFA